MMGGSIGCGLLLSVVNYCYLLWFVCSIIAFYIPSARFFPFPFSLFTKIRKCNSHSSFFILHSSFFILHSSFYILHLRRAPVSGALPPDIFPVFCYFHWLTSTKRQISHIFRKNIPKSFGSSEKKQYLCTRFPENGTAETNKLLTQTVKKGSDKKEFFEKIYIKQKVVVQEASEKSLG